jgi:hypothetical protein
MPFMPLAGVLVFGVLVFDISGDGSGLFAIARAELGLVFE